MSGFIKHTPQEAQYSSTPFALTFASHSNKFRILSVQPSLRVSNDLLFGRSMATFQVFFLSREQVVVRRGHIRRIDWMIKTLEGQVGQFLLGCKCPWAGALSCKKKTTLVNSLRAFSCFTLYGISK